MNMSSVIRLAATTDAAAINTIYAPIVEETIISLEFVSPSVEEMAQRIEAVTAHYPWLVCEHDGAIAGYAYASQHSARAGYQWAANVSVYVHAGWRGRGVGRGLYIGLLALLQAQGYYGAYAGISLPNPASVALHQSVGFTPVGVYRAVGYKFGAWHDVGWWECELRQRIAEPAPLVSIGELVAGPSWDAAIAAGLAAIH